MTPCSLAKLHVPGQPNPDEHHVIPRAWQAVWAPPEQPLLGAIRVPLGPEIVIHGPWDPRTVTVCPNHHRLVHEAIAAMMHAGHTEDPAEAYRAAFGSSRTTRVRQTASLALMRWVDAGGSLSTLRAAKLYGEQ